MSDVEKVLLRNGYTLEPEFVILGRLSSSGPRADSSSLGRGISAIAAFGDFVVHIFGRMGGESGVKLLASDQVLVREVPYSDFEGVDLTLVEGVGAVLTLSVKGKGGIFQRVLAGGDVIVAIGKSDLESYRPLVEKLRQRIA